MRRAYNLLLDLLDLVQAVTFYPLLISALVLYVVWLLR